MDSKMPQLMPLLWIFSLFMLSFIVLVLIKLYNYNSFLEMNFCNVKHKKMSMIWQW